MCGGPEDDPLFYRGPQNILLNREELKKEFYFCQTIGKCIRYSRPQEAIPM